MNIEKINKICIECNISKPLKDFYLRKDTGRYRNICKKCDNTRSITWRKDLKKDNSEHLKRKRDENIKIELLKNGFKLCSRCKQTKNIVDFYLCSNNKYSHYCKICSYEKANEWAINNKSRKSINRKLFYLLHKEKEKLYQKEYYYNHIPQIKEYYRKNKNRFIKDKESINVNIAYRVKHDIQFKLRKSLHNRLLTIKKNINCFSEDKTMELLGCTLTEFKNWIEKWFQQPENNGMNWSEFFNNKIHLDHIIPCNMFVLNNSEERDICFHYTNLQPLWAKDNNSKGASYIGHPSNPIYINK